MNEEKRKSIIPNLMKECIPILSFECQGFSRYIMICSY